MPHTRRRMCPGLRPRWILLFSLCSIAHIKCTLEKLAHIKCTLEKLAHVSWNLVQYENYWRPCLKHLHGLTLEIVETLEPDHNTCGYLVFHPKCGCMHMCVWGGYLDFYAWLIFSRWSSFCELVESDNEDSWFEKQNIPFQQLNIILGVSKYCGFKSRASLPCWLLLWY